MIVGQAPHSKTPATKHTFIFGVTHVKERTADHASISVAQNDILIRRCAALSRHVCHTRQFN